MIDHAKLCELCELLDHPIKGLAESSNKNKQRESILALVMYDLHKTDDKKQDYYIESRGRGTVKATLTNTQAFHLSQIAEQIEITSITKK